MTRQPRRPVLLATAAAAAVAGSYLLITPGAPSTQQRHELGASPRPSESAGSSGASTPAHNVPATPATSTGTPATTHPPTPSATPTAPTGDPRTREMTPTELQALMDQGYPNQYRGPLAGRLRHEAWDTLFPELAGAGYTQPQLQASAITTPGRDLNDPTVLDVVLMWSAMTTGEGPIERQISTVRAVRSGDQITYRLETRPVL